MNKEYNEVKKFQQAFGRPYSETPITLPLERAKKRYAWMLEKMNRIFKEFINVCKNEVKMEL